ncbi:MAG TPA: hypothetical protein VFD16_01695 [Candidatus Saccharimonadales bacterium]|nr:hypothetical protein [Candidatus Saccharimonadales bacterium]
MEHNKQAKISQNITILVALLIAFSAAIYYFYRLNSWGITITIILSIISLIILNKYRLVGADKADYQPEKINPKYLKLSKIVIVYLILLAAATLELIHGRSGRPLISPWEVVSGRFFWFYALSSLILITSLVQRNLSRTTKLLLISSHYFLSLAVAVIVYKVGYGFDPFIHQAAMEIINKTGIILPKTPYYLGEYGLIIIIHKLLGISIYALNKFLVPLAAALLLPKAIYRLFTTLEPEDKKNNSASFLGTLFALTLSLPLFIVSTPQNFSYIFVILAITSGLTRKHKTETLIFSVATAAIHPLSGIPVLIWSAWLIFKTHFQKLKVNSKKIISALILSGGAILLPVALFIISGSRIENLKLNLTIISAAGQDIFKLAAAGNENWLLNLIYFIFYNYKILIVALIVSGLVIFYQKKLLTLSENKKHVWRGLLSINGSLILAFILSAQISFGQVITYEQAGYSRRIINIIAIFFLPFIALTINWLIVRINSQKETLLKFIWLIIGAAFISISLYTAYPRFDKYFNSRGYSTSVFDLEAVQKIAAETKEDYLVLANQQVSAGALRLLGFNHYFKGHQGEEIYFYPIPTGGILYQYFLDMVYKNPDRKTMLMAMDEVGTNEAYLVINKYWNESGKIIAAAKLNANSWSVIANNEIFIFKYNR